jgi:hypothetical protein
MPPALQMERIDLQGNNALKRQIQIRKYEKILFARGTLSPSTSFGM